MDKIQISCLGKLGRFGNQLHQYAFARAYANKYGCILETPKWIGNDLFNINDSTISTPLPRNNEMDIIEWGGTNIDLFGHFQFQRAIELYSKAKVRQWLQFRPEIQKRYRGRRHKIVAHLRRTDYHKYPTVYCVVSKQSYIDACAKFGYDPADITWISDENQSPDPLGFLSDFFAIMDADVLFRSNSTFSWWASTLGTCRTYAPLVGNRVGEQTVEFVEGNWPGIADSRNNPNYRTILTDLHLPE